MKYISTRNKNIRLDSSQAILQGISEEGGLFVPSHIPLINDLDRLINMDYRETAFYVLEKFFPQLGKENLKNAINMAYDEKFIRKDIVSIKNTMGVNFLELFHGETLAFKDMALCILPHLLKISKDINNIKKEIVILTATSGDTGKAALEGFKDVKGIRILVFFPEEGVSSIQKLQMVTQEGKNTFVVAIKGNFDDVQNGVKEILNNKEFKVKLENNNYMFSSANSINIGRLIPQIVYYIYSYCELVRKKEIEIGEKINIVVPTGNFGNILAAYYGKHMGVPVNKLICASNDNDVLTRFFNQGKYDIKKSLVLTTSPSMDILISSNLERLLFHLSHGNQDLVKEKMENLLSRKEYEALDLDTREFYANYANEEQVSQGIKEVFEEGNYLIDPHTAVGYSVYRKYQEETRDRTKTIIVSTASPFKFGNKVASSIGIDVKNKDEFTILEELANISGKDLPKNIEGLRKKHILHKNSSIKEDMAGMIHKFLKVGEIND